MTPSTRFVRNIPLPWHELSGFTISVRDQLVFAAYYRTSSHYEGSYHVRGKYS